MAPACTTAPLAPNATADCHEPGGHGAFVIGDVMNARLAVFDSQGRLEKMIGCPRC
jgi:hypothetical protein